MWTASQSNRQAPMRVDTTEPAGRAMTPWPAGPNPTSAERRLLAAALVGDERAVGLLYDAHADALYRLARCALGPGAGAESIVVDVIVEACTPPGLHAGGAATGSLRFELARRTYERCRDRRPGGPGGPAGTALALFLFAGCSCREVALIVGCAPVGLPVLLARDLKAIRRVAQGPYPPG